jgi:outer membrane receptor for ferrienterochelin and colicins
MKKFRIVLLAIVLFAAISTTFADKKGDKAPKLVTLSGKVIDKTSQEALAGALIRVEGTDIEVYTDLDGNFSISGLMPDTYTVKCSMISYSDREEEVKIDNKAGNLRISLQDVAAEQVSR